MTCRCDDVDPSHEWRRPRSWPGPQPTWEPSPRSGAPRPPSPRLPRLPLLQRTAEAAAPEAAAPEAAESPEIEQLKQYAALKDQGILTEEEFAAKKAQILGL